MLPTGMTWVAVAPGRQALEAEVAEFERRIALELPRDYRQFLLTLNGGHPRPKYWEIPVKWRADLSSLDEPLPLITLFSLGGASDDGLDAWLDSRIDDIPSGAIPIGRSTSPVFLLMLDGSRRGQVLVWLPDTWQDQTDPEQLGFAAASFSEFLAKLTHVAPD